MLFSDKVTPVGEFDEETEKKLLADCIKRVREEFLEEKIKKIRLDLKQNPNPEKLKEIADLKQQIVILNRN